MYGVFRHVRVGNMALHAFDRELAAHGAASAVFDHVAGALDRGRLAHNDVIQHFTARFEGVSHHHGAVDSRAFFVTGQQQRDIECRVWRVGQKLFNRHHKGR